MSNGQTEPTPTPDQQAAYARGKREGLIDARLDQHEERLDKINGSLDRFATEMSGLKLGVQRLGDEARSAATTVLATAKALKDERDATAAALRATTDRSNQRWTPAMRLGALMGSLAAFMTGTVTIYLALKP